ncbi:MAG TPA: Na+/H+ antiporter NhaA [Actinomycetota bacterium]|nr:Na+/H+ antiporter NhaA [Actinomycetota bacterium]
MPRLLARPIRTFLDTEASGGVVLLLATLAALVWANSPWSSSYDTFWHTEIALEAGSRDLTLDLRHWVNDGLMTLFFFVVGLEIKRELVVGELNDARKAMLPAIAALGGMAGPALLYLAFNAGEPGGPGWGIPMATDIAFAVGVLAVLGSRIPSGLKVFLLSLAIVDDIGAIVVIALFYAGGLEPGWLLAAVALLAFVVCLRRVRVHWVPVYALLGAAVWFTTFQSGVHATIAGVALGLLAPARPADPRGFADVLATARSLSDEPDAGSLRSVMLEGREVVPVAERLGHLLHPYTSFIIVPLFALANAGVALSSDGVAKAVTSRVGLGVIVGLVAGKILGITGAAWLASRSGLGRLPSGVAWPHVVGASAVAGIGFTVSLFITALAFETDALVAQAKVGILLASVAAGVLGALVLWRAPAADERV